MPKKEIKAWAAVNKLTGEIENEAYFCESDCPAGPQPESLAIYPKKKLVPTMSGGYKAVQVTITLHQ